MAKVMPVPAFQRPVQEITDGKICGMQFGMLNDRILEALSSVEITSPSTEMKPGITGLNTLKLGPTSRWFVCETCGKPSGDCPGHMGHIVSSVPLFNPITLDLVAKIMSSVCFHCSRLLVQPHYTHLSKTKKTSLKIKASDSVHARVVKIAKFCKTIRVCGLERDTTLDTSITEDEIMTSGCGRKQPEVTKEKLTVSVNGLPPSYRHAHMNTVVYEVLDGIRNADAMVFGFSPDDTEEGMWQPETASDLSAAESCLSHPRDLMHCLIPVPPTNARSVGSDGMGGRSVCDLSTKMQHILKNMDKLAAILAQQEAELKEATTLAAAMMLQNHANANAHPKDEEEEEEQQKQKQKHVQELPDDTHLMVEYMDPSPEELEVMTTDPEISSTAAYFRKRKYFMNIIDTGDDRVDRQIMRFLQKGNTDAKDLIHHIQFDFATMITNKIRGVKQPFKSNGQPYGSYKAILSSKTGIIRKSGGGTRIDYSFRTVDGADGYMDIDQAGIPWDVLRKETVPCHVTPLNINDLQSTVRRGPDGRNGANTIIVAKDHPMVKRDSYGNVMDGARLRSEDSEGRVIIDLRFVDCRTVVLEVGMIVERHGRDGDIIFHGRQPSIHAGSVLAHIVKGMTGNTNRFSLAITAIYNMDFDGDTSWGAIVRDAMMRADAMKMLPSKNILSRMNGLVEVYPIQDTVIAAWKTCSFFFTREQIMQAVCACPKPDRLKRLGMDIPPPAVVGRRRSSSSGADAISRSSACRWTGLQLLSEMLPRGLYLDTRRPAGWNAPSARVPSSTRTTDDDDDDDAFASEEGHVLIEDGEIIFGLVTKGVLKKIIKILATDRWDDGCSGRVAADFIHNLQVCMIYTMGLMGSTVSYEHCTNPVKEHTAAILAKTQAWVESDEAQTATMGDLCRVLKGATSRIASRALGALRKSNRTAGRDRNGLLDMCDSGSKGSASNITQMCGIVGPQFVGGKLTVDPLTNHSVEDEEHDYRMTLEEKGFIGTPFSEQITPLGSYRISCGGREGLVDTAVKTSDCGYLTRQALECLADLVISTGDHVVRDSQGNIIQLSYGGDDCNAMRMEKGFLVTLAVDPLTDAKAFESRFHGGRSWSGSGSITSAQADVLDAEFAQLLADRQAAAAALRRDREFDIDHVCAVDTTVPFDRILRRVLESGERRPRRLCDVITPWEAASRVKAFCERLSREHVLLTSFVTGHNRFLVLLRSWLCSANLVGALGVTRQELEDVLRHVETMYVRGRVEAGEAVGLAAAHSLTKVSLQMTLNTFHLAGMGSGITMGVSRLKEVFRVSKDMKPKAPMMTVRLRATPEDVCGEWDEKNPLHAEWVEARARSLVFQTVSDFAGPGACVDIHDSEAAAGDFDQAVKDSVIHIPLNRTECLKNRVFPSDVASAVLCAHYRGEEGFTFEGPPDLAEVKFTSTDAADWSVDVYLGCVTDRIRDRAAKFSRMDPEDLLEHVLDLELTDLLEKTTVKGVPGIRGATLKWHKTRFDRSGRFRTSDFTEPVILTAGTNLRQVCALDFVDATKTHSNDIREVERVLGITAAKMAISREVDAVMDFNGIFVDKRYGRLVASRMTFYGLVTAMVYEQIMSRFLSTVRRMAFERPVDVLFESALAGAYDECAGPSESTMVGTVARVGVGTVQVLSLPKRKRVLLDDPAEIKRQQAIMEAGKRAQAPVAYVERPQSFFEDLMEGASVAPVRSSLLLTEKRKRRPKPKARSRPPPQRRTKQQEEDPARKKNKNKTKAAGRSTSSSSSSSKGARRTKASRASAQKTIAAKVQALQKERRGVRYAVPKKSRVMVPVSASGTVSSAEYLLTDVQVSPGSSVENLSVQLMSMFDGVPRPKIKSMTVDVTLMSRDPSDDTFGIGVSKEFFLKTFNDFKQHTGWTHSTPTWILSERSHISGTGSLTKTKSSGSQCFRVVTKATHSLVRSSYSPDLALVVRRSVVREQKKLSIVNSKKSEETVHLVKTQRFALEDVLFTFEMALVGATRAEARTGKSQLFVVKVSLARPVSSEAILSALQKVTVRGLQMISGTREHENKNLMVPRTTRAPARRRPEPSFCVVSKAALKGSEHKFMMSRSSIPRPDVPKEVKRNGTEKKAAVPRKLPPGIHKCPTPGCGNTCRGRQCRDCHHAMVRKRRREHRARRREQAVREEEQRVAQETSRRETEAFLATVQGPRPRQLFDYSTAAPSQSRSQGSPVYSAISPTNLDTPMSPTDSAMSPIGGGGGFSPLYDPASPNPAGQMSPIYDGGGMSPIYVPSSDLAGSPVYSAVSPTPMDTGQ